MIRSPIITCPKCGNKNKVALGQTDCFNCGAELPEESLPDESERAVEALPDVPTNPKELEPLTPQSEQKLVGLKGWLILPAIGLVFSIIVTPFGLIAGLANMTDSITHHTEYAFPSLFVNAMFYIWIWVAAIQFFKKRRTFPLTLIQLLVARIVASVVFFVWGLAVIEEPDADVVFSLLVSYNFIGQGIGAAIWIPYLKKSKRVKATFTN